MTDWTAGYVADIDYTFGYYKELNPLRVKLAFLSAGLVVPEIGSACELGFGQGLSANLHAAASMTNWHGTDFNPGHAGFAQELAAASGAGGKLCDDAFADYLERPDLPDFDYIGIHGIWSWISDENRRLIVEFIRRKLKVGGVLYISYNTLPGWAGFAPLRHLMAEHANIIGAEGAGIVSRVLGAVDFTEKLLATNPKYARAHPGLVEQIAGIKDEDHHYLAHEFFCRDWHPMHFATIADWLEPAKLDYACSADYLDHIDALNLSADQQAFLKAIPDTMFRESTRDFMVNKKFRRDYWVKGARKLNPVEQIEALRAQRVLLISHRPDISLKVTGDLGELTPKDAIYDHLLDLLADHQPRTLGQLEHSLKHTGVTFVQLLQAIIVLIGANELRAVQEDAVISKARKSADKINRHLINKSRGSGDITYLASPVIGGGVDVGQFEQLFLLAISEGRQKPEEWAAQVWHALVAQGQKLFREDQELKSPEEGLVELTARATTFAEVQLPILQALGIAA